MERTPSVGFSETVNPRIWDALEQIRKTHSIPSKAWREVLGIGARNHTLWMQYAKEPHILAIANVAVRYNLDFRSLLRGEIRPAQPEDQLRLSLWYMRDS